MSFWICFCFFVIVTHFPKCLTFFHSEYYYTNVAWASNSNVLVWWLNRIQDTSIASICDAPSGNCTEVRALSSTVPFLSSEAALLLVSTKNRDLWEGLTPEVYDSQTFRLTNLIGWEYEMITLRMIRNWIGPTQRMTKKKWFLVLTKRSAASENKNAAMPGGWAYAQTSGFREQSTSIK